MTNPSYRDKSFHGGMNQPEQITDEFLTCRFCQEEFKHAPKLLACGHSICEPCINAYTACGTACRDVCCPTCGRPTPIPESKDCSVAGMRNDLGVQTQIDYMLRRHNNAMAPDVSLHYLHNYEILSEAGMARFGTDRYCYDSDFKHQQANQRQGC